MSIPTTLTELVTSKAAERRYAGNVLALAAAVNRYTYPVQDTFLNDRPSAIVAKEAAAKEAVIDAAIAMGTPIADRGEVWNALLNLSGAGFIGRARQLVESSRNETERLRRVEAAATIQALFLAAKEAEAAGAKSYRDPSFGKATETVTVTTRRRWIDEHNNGQQVTPEQVKKALSE